MPHLLSLAEAKGKAGVFRMYVADSRRRCGGPNPPPQDNLLVSDGRKQWMGHAGRWHGTFHFSDAWLYEPTDLDWRQFAMDAPLAHVTIEITADRRLLLCDTPRSR